MLRSWLAVWNAPGTELTKDWKWSVLISQGRKVTSICDVLPAVLQPIPTRGLESLEELVDKQVGDGVLVVIQGLHAYMSVSVPGCMICWRQEAIQMVVLEVSQSHVQTLSSPYFVGEHMFI